jgi:VCBS repeat-containing protein
MRSVRRWALLVVSLVLAGAAAAAFALTASASASSPVRSNAPTSATPVQMNYACTSPITDFMRYVTSPTKCSPFEKAVTIAPGPVYVCVLYGFLVRQVPSLSDCSGPFTKALTLPPTTGPAYFCATSAGDLSYATSPSQCRFGQFPVEVPVPHTSPVLANIETSTLQYSAGSPPVTATSTLTVSSANATTLASATVTISSGLAAGEDSLRFTNQNGITGSYDSSTGVLTLSGTASLADYQAALRSVTYYDSNGTSPTTGTRTISFQVNDGFPARNLSNVVSRNISVGPNSPPTCGAVSASTDKQTAIDINVLASCSDPDGDTLTVVRVDTTGTKGSVSINPSGTIHYDPNGQFQNLTAGQSATDSFSYTVSDGFSTATEEVGVTVLGVNEPPVLSNVETSPLTYQAQAAAVPITSTLTISDADDATIGGATVSITSGFLSGSDTLGFTNQNGITGSYDSSTGVLTLTGNALIADYQAALRSVTFFTSDSSASPAARMVSFTVIDSLGATSNSAQRTIVVSKAS